MKVTIHLEGANKAELAKQYAAHAALLADSGAATTTTPKSTKATKAAAAAEEEEEFVEPTEEEEEIEAGAAEETEEEETEEEEEEETAPATMADLVLALNKYSKKHTRADAKLLLKKKFKVSEIKELKKSQYADVIAALKK